MTFASDASGLLEKVRSYTRTARASGPQDWLHTRVQGAAYWDIIMLLAPAYFVPPARSLLLRQVRIDRAATNVRLNFEAGNTLMGSFSQTCSHLLANFLSPLHRSI
jgi:hypothetical protein